jgi:hypothetical protein
MLGDLTLNPLVASSRVIGTIDDRLMQWHQPPCFHSILLFLNDRRAVRPRDH